MVLGVVGAFFAGRVWQWVRDAQHAMGYRRNRSRS